MEIFFVNYVFTVNFDKLNVSLLKKIFKSWQVSEDFRMVMDMLMYLVLAE